MATGEAALELHLQLCDVNTMGKLECHPLGGALEADGSTKGLGNCRVKFHGYSRARRVCARSPS